METAIRWSSTSNLSQQRFLLADVNGRTFKHCQVDVHDGKDIHYEVLSTHRKVPPFRAYDWSSHDENLVAVGQWSGEATILRLDDEARQVQLPIKHQRLCNAVTFSPVGLLATGLERVRNDFCLNIWDIERGPITSSSPSSPRTPSSRNAFEPMRKFASSEGIASIKFFSQPDTLVTGVKATSLRIYDLREHTGNPTLQFHTGCVHNIAIDPLDENYFASAAPGKDSTIQIWDRRAGSYSATSTLASGPQYSQQAPALEFSKAFAGSQSSSQGTIWSLRFCKGQRGCLGALASTGDFKVFQMQKQYLASEGHDYNSQEGEQSAIPGLINTKRIWHIEKASADGANKDQESDLTVSFDFTHLGGPHGKPCAIVLRADHTVGLRELESPPPAMSLSLSGTLAIGKRPSFSYDQEQSKDDRYLTNLMDMKFSSDASISDDSYQKSVRNAQLSSRGAHEHLTIPRAGMDFESALSLSNVIQRRCIEGYLFNCTRNAQIVSDDPWLQDMWTWIART